MSSHPRPTDRRVARRSWWRAAPLAATVALATLVAGLPGTAGADPSDAPDSAADSAADGAADGDDVAGAGEIPALREEARELEAEIEELGRRASIVLDEYHAARDRLAAADEALDELRSSVERLRGAVEAARSEVQDRIVSMYQGRDGPSPLTYLDSASLSELGVRHHYAGTIARRDRAAVEELAARERELAEREDELTREREELAARTRALAEQREEVEEAMARRREVLERAEGKLAELVEEERRREAEEARRRARATTTTSSSTSTTTSSSSTTTSSSSTSTTTASTRPTTSSTAASPPAPTTTTTAPPEADSPSPAGLPPVHPQASVAVRTALDQLGDPYRWAATGPDAFDCSGLTTYAWAAVGVSFPRSSRMQQAALPHVPRDHLRPGDLVFFGDPVHHVGVYIGEGEMVNAPYSGTTVRIDSIDRSDYAGAGRPG